jgi:chemotaxis protein MotB
MSRNKRKKKKDEFHTDESWLIPYADILTLLLALFVVLFAMSSVDAKKFQEFSKVFSGIFTGGTGVLDYTKPEPVDQNDTTGNGEIQIKQQNNLKSPTAESKQLEKMKSVDYQQLQDTQSKVEAYIQKNNLQGKFSTKLTDEGLLLTIRDNVLFASGQATVRPQDVKTAKEVSNLLVMDPPRNIIISGHTDNVPIQNSNFQSNWELSVMRALNFMKLLLENNQLNPKYFSVKGYGEYQPVADNSTAEGRAANRRVEVLILPHGKSPAK